MIGVNSDGIGVVGIRGGGALYDSFGFSARLKIFCYVETEELQIVFFRVLHEHSPPRASSWGGTVLSLQTASPASLGSSEERPKDPGAVRSVWTRWGLARVRPVRDVGRDSLWRWRVPWSVWGDRCSEKHRVGGSQPNGLEPELEGAEPPLPEFESRYLESGKELTLCAGNFLLSMRSSVIIVLSVYTPIS